MHVCFRETFLGLPFLVLLCFESRTTPGQVGGMREGKTRGYFPSCVCIGLSAGLALQPQVIYLAVHLLLRGFLFCVLGSGQCAMVVWDAGSRVDGATQGGGYRLCSCSTGLITPLKKERRLAHPSPHHECLLAYPCMTLRPLTGPPWGFHPTLCLIISDEQRCVLTWRAIQGDCVHVQACPGDGPPLLEESNEWSIKRRLNPNDAEFANSPLTLTTKPHTTHTNVHST